MKIKKKSIDKKTIAFIVVVLLLATGVGAYAHYRYALHSGDSSKSGSSTNLDTATDEEKAAGDQAKSSSASTNDTSSNSEKNNANSSSSANTDSSTAVNVQTSASAQNGSVYQLRYLISAVVNDATCTLTLTQDSKTITRTASTQALAQSSTCEGFDIPTSDLSSGSWQVVMVVSGGSITGSTRSTIQVQ